MGKYYGYRTKYYESADEMKNDMKIMEFNNWVVKGVYHQWQIPTGKPYWVTYEKVYEVGK